MEEGRAGSLPNLVTLSHVVLDGQNRHIRFLLRRKMSGVGDGCLAKTLHSIDLQL